MIKAEKKNGGIEVVLEGDTIEDILDEFIAVIKGFHARIEGETDTEIANLFVAMCGQLAFSHSDEDIDNIIDMIHTFMKKKCEEKGVIIN